MNTNLPKIYRTKVIQGVSIPGIIKNGNHFFVDLDVYEDGRVECWNFEDFNHFSHDVKTGWVAVNIPNGKEISIHSLGSWVIADGEWLHSKDSFIEYVWSIVKQLNPNLDNIYKYVEKKVNNITMGEDGKGKLFKENRRFPQDPFPEKIKGKNIDLFFKDETKKYHLIRLDIYKQNSIIINRFSQPFEINLADLEKLIHEQKIVSQVPIGATVQILGLGNFKIQEERYTEEIAEKLLEIKDLIRTLEGQPSAVQICKTIHEEYKSNPTSTLKDQLKEAYENIPKHQRMYVGDMDTKDVPIRMIIYGKEEIENWSHYQVAKARNKPLPNIHIPKPKED